MELIPPGSSAHGILQAGTVQWIAFPCPGTFPDPDIKPESPALQADSLPCEPPGKPLYMLFLFIYFFNFCLAPLLPFLLTL